MASKRFLDMFFRGEVKVVRPVFFPVIRSVADTYKASEDDDGQEDVKVTLGQSFPFIKVREYTSVVTWRLFISRNLMVLRNTVSSSTIKHRK